MVYKSYLACPVLYLQAHLLNLLPTCTNTNYVLKHSLVLSRPFSLSFLFLHVPHLHHETLSPPLIPAFSSHCHFSDEAPLSSRNLSCHLKSESGTILIRIRVSTNNSKSKDSKLFLFIYLFENPL